MRVRLWKQVLRRTELVQDKVRGRSGADNAPCPALAAGSELADELWRERPLDGVCDEAADDGQELQAKWLSTRHSGSSS